MLFVAPGMTASRPRTTDLCQRTNREGVCCPSCTHSLLSTNMSSKKSTQFTVFVRFNPPNANLRRHHTEQWFAGVGPIKKSSLIHQDNKVYGFIKYTCQQDTEQAVKEYNNKAYTVDGEKVQVQMVLADKASSSASAVSTTPSATAPKDTLDKRQPEQSQEQQHDRRDTHEVYRKKACRLILRNLAFSATEREIRKSLSTFGPLTEVHIPTVTGAPTHRGFAFVTFEKVNDANECLKAAGNIMIGKRPVQVAHSLNKADYDQQKQKGDQKGKDKRFRNDEKMNVVEEKKDHDENSDDDHEEHDGEESDDQSETGSTHDFAKADDDSHMDEKSQEEGRKSDRNAALAEKRALFIRNLPFDVSRHDLFELFRKYGKIDSIYLCKGENGIAKGTAFLNYVKPAAAQRAVQAADVSGGAGGDFDGAGILLSGRRLLVDLAVDKETATTLTIDKNNVGGKDRRNMYLRTEGRVDETSEWEALPAADKEKRQRAWADKNTKLKSPIFFINPTRLSFRNLAKHVDETGLKKLLVSATAKGIEKKLVSAQDQIAMWKAKGDMTTREILARIQEIEEGEDGENSILPAFDSANVRRYIPSVFIDRDYSKGDRKDAPSRGFGFAQFEHHVHALACLRELNNNTDYTKDFVAGGSRAWQALKRPKKSKKKAAFESDASGLTDEDGQVKLPRLVVEFTVENKVKAKQQVEHRAHQEANVLKQKLEGKSSKKKKEKNKARGARQRENRRKAQEMDGETAEVETTNAVASEAMETEEHLTVEKTKMAKPPKKKPKIDPSEKKFNDLVETYKRSFVASTTIAEVAGAASAEKSEKRWFE
ncbi:hypothetical protein MPSEU_000735200 [Mayamaea pseudoterrestris]|nr:hypothetical protein MPSEU_000735200 [Mayamaea pseudoterrestris]